MKTCYVVGGGESLTGFNFNVLMGKNTIVINKALFYVHNPTYFITLDYTFLRKIQIDKFIASHTNKIFVINFGSGQLDVINNKITDIRSHRTYDKLNLFSTVIRSNIIEGVGLNNKDFRTGNNSGYCGLQLALILGYKKIYLLGFDLIAKNKTHFHDGYTQNITYFNKNLRSYQTHFMRGFEQIKQKFPDVSIISMSKDSILNRYIEYRGLNTI